MKQRIITGVIGGIGFLALLLLGDIPYYILILLLGLIGYKELAKMNNIKLISIESILGMFIVFSIITFQNKSMLFDINLLTMTSINNFNNLILATLIIYLTLVVLTKNKLNFDNIAFLFVGALYIGFGFSYMLNTRLMENGLTLTLFILLITWSSDTGAYFTGKYFGKNKLWPAISPNKTIEGALGAIFFASLIGLVINIFLQISDSIYYTIFIGVLISILGQIGDLVESALKRSKNVKDSGSILPGHGGVLDRFDSLLFVFSVLYLLHII